MLDQLKISMKLLIGFGAVLALMAMVSWFNISNSGKISRQVDHVKEVRYQVAIDTINAINLSEKILSKLVNAAEAAVMAPLQSAEQNKEVLLPNLETLSRSLKEDQILAEKLEQFRALFEACFENGKQMVQHSVNQELFEYVASRDEYQKYFQELEKAAAELNVLVSKALYETLEQINQVSEKNVQWSRYLTLFGLILGFALSVIISRNIANPMKHLVDVIVDIGHGNLSKRVCINRGDEIGQVASAMDEMAEKLGQMVKRVRASSEEFTNVSGAVSDAAKSVSASAKNQEESIESTSGAIVEIGASIESVAQNVDSLNVSASDSTSSSLEMASSIEEVAENSLRLANAVESIGSSIHEMASAVTQVAGNAEQLKKTSDATSSTVAEMDATIKQVDEHAHETARSTAEVLQDARQGQDSVEKTIAGITQIKSSSHITSEAVGNLAEKVKDIGSILAVIDEITEQTNLLALNAAIISAQAGQHGKGFAVVADEIRELSERTSQSTRKIEEVIADVQRETARAVNAIKQTETIVGEGEQLSLQSGNMLGKIVSGVEDSSGRVDHIVRTTVEQAQASKLMRESMEKVSEMVAQIASATKQQDQGARSITSATELIAELTEQVKNSTREQSQSSQAIGQAMEKMSGLVQHVKTACDQQNEESSNIVQAVDGIKDSARGNVTSVNSLNSAVEKLSHEIIVLQEEMAAFRIEE